MILRRCICALALVSCGSSGSGGGSSESARAPTDPTIDAGAPPARPPGSVDTAGILGVWRVEGSDARGPYHGQAEVRADGPRTRLVRVVRYDAATVEDGKELWLAWEGDAVIAGDAATFAVPLATRDFVTSRGSLARSTSDPPTIEVEGRATAASGAFDVSFTDGAAERWTSRVPSSASPIFATSRTLAPTHPPIAASKRQALFTTYATYYDRADVAPYLQRAEFQAAEHGAYLDRTDFDFYQAHPAAIRVVNKVVDVVSLLETELRASAFRWTLAAKAKAADQAMTTRFLPGAAWMVPDSIASGGAIVPSTDSALWTGTYVASQIYRFQVTGEAEARENALASLDAMLRLQEITGDWSAFARVLRPAQGSPVAPWHAGTGPNAGLEWKEGGNNDMVKGLIYAYAVSYPALCGGASEPPQCARLRTNAKHLADDVHTSQGTNDVLTNWLAAWVAGSVTHRLKAESLFAAWKQLATNVPALYDDGTADWSGLHLGFVDYVSRLQLSTAMPLDGGNSTKAIVAFLARDHDIVAEQRLAAWHLLRGAFDPTGLAAARRDDLVWRLREYRFPKVEYAMDHRINPEFCLSPWPELPWKNDWATADRLASLRLYPLFEDQADVYVWKSHFTFTEQGSLAETSPADYLHAYWFGRRHGVLAATD